MAKTKAKEEGNESHLDSTLSKLDGYQILPIDTFDPLPWNPREDLQPGDPDYQAIERSLDEFGLVEPLVGNDATGNLVGGHQRHKILKAKGKTHAPFFVVSIPDPEKEKALNLALNKAQGRWDPEKLMMLEESSGPDVFLLGGFQEGEAYQMMKTAEQADNTSFLADFLQPGQRTGPGGDGEEGDGSDRKREIDLKEEHAHRSGEQFFEVTLVFTREQRALYYMAIDRAKSYFAGSDKELNSYEALCAVLQRFIDDVDPGQPAPTADLT